MDLDYKGQEQIPVAKDTVWAFINDPAKVASCLPNLVESQVVDDHNVDATVKVAVGPVSGRFKFKIALLPRADGNHLDMKISGNGFGSVLDLTAGADLTEANGGTTLDWTGHASMRGSVATVGGRVLDEQAQRVISTTFSNVKAKLMGTA